MKTQTVVSKVDSTIKGRARLQLGNYLKSKGFGKLEQKTKLGVAVFSSKVEKDLIYIDFGANERLSEDQLKEKFEKDFNTQLNPWGITVEVRKNWV